ncbi:MAG: hypothetical protein ABJA98_18455 [Acidobacteriota bacterium]
MATRTQPTRAHEQRTHARNAAISQAEAGGTSPGAIERQQLPLAQSRLGRHGTRTARIGEPGDGRQEVKK